MPESGTQPADAGTPAPRRTVPRARGGPLWHEGEWYVSAVAVSTGVRKLVLKDNDAFVVADGRGDFPGWLSSEFGYYFGGTRFLSRLDLRVHGDLPLVLDVSSDEDDRRLLVELTNGEVWDLGVRRVPANTLHLRREIVLERDVLFQRLALHNFDLEPVEVELTLNFDADFADIFEARGSKRSARGERLPTEIDAHGMRLSYLGLDGVLRTTEIAVEPQASEFAEQRLAFRLSLGPGQDRDVRVRIRPVQEIAAKGKGSGGAGSAVLPARAPPAREVIVPAVARREARTRMRSIPRIETDHEGLNRVLDRALRDIVTMLSETPEGLYPYAGIPWYCAPFGRDGSITALQLLPWIPEVARGVLSFQARHQARDFDDFTDREPGKIFHELRTGEMAALREIPFVPYYGSADATPLFLVLLREYVRATDDRELLDRIWPNALAAVEWMHTHGDLDGDGLIEYQARCSIGLRNQGWKDSHDSISHAEGTLAEPPIAVCEVQGYALRALEGCAELAELRGESRLTELWRARARKLRETIHERYWLEERGYYALALDAAKRPCEVLTTNAGHLLWAGAAEEAAGRRLATLLASPELFTGYGLRTLAASEARYSPLSYHNGSIWPHDNAIVAEGLRRYGNVQGFLEVFAGILNAIEQTVDWRVPELFCGFPRTHGSKPIPYPVACAPQAWSSGAMLQFVSTLLGLSVDGATGQVLFEDPVMPPWLDWLEVSGLAVPGGTLDFAAVRGRTSCSIEIVSKPDAIRVVVRK